MQKINYRYERKFKLTGFSLEQLEMMVRMHPLRFLQAYPARQNNNIYFDSITFGKVDENKAGIANRCKIRIRWYGDTFGAIQSPRVEFKVKHGMAGHKIRYKIPPFHLVEGDSVQDTVATMDLSDLPPTARLQLLSLNPVLLNSYTRHYYQLSDSRFRLTLDQNMSYWKLDRFSNRFFNKVIDRESIIIEIKYPIEEEAMGESIIRQLPFRITKSSKYVSGIMNLHA